MKPDDPIEHHFRLTPFQLSALHRLGITTIGNLLRHFPARYERNGASSEVRALTPGSKVVLVGMLSKLKARKLWKSRRNITEGWFEDSSGRVKVMWFNQPYIASYVSQTSLVRVIGVVGGSVEKPYIANPEVEAAPPGATSEGLFSKKESVSTENTVFPVYPESKGVTSRWFYHALERMFASDILSHIEDPIPPDVGERYHLPHLALALRAMHKPSSEREAEGARKRFAFEEIFTVAVARAQERAENATLPSFHIENGTTLADTFLESIPFPPTKAQEKAIADILRDFEKSHPMARLLEGDVGSGKTLVAAATAYAVVHARPLDRNSGTLQVAYMAPTEILAQQHFDSFVRYFSHLPIQIALMTGSGCKKFPSKVKRGDATDISRSQLLKWVANGEIAMLVGTHALIQKSVTFQNLAYVIVDEQHRFGTRQRRELAHKSVASGKPHGKPGKTSGRQSPAPHFLSMTATPIPRTLALTLYGDLDISVLDELPAGRASVKTAIIMPDERGRAYTVVREELQRGRQAFVICPRIEEPDPEKFNAVQAKSAKAEAKRLKADVFPEFEIGLLHGSLKPTEKEKVMSDFASGNIQLLVATSVVEVGINVPNATVILIEGAERFGLAQLHQLRGRIQRSSFQPYCFLLPETTGVVAMRRLRAVEKSNNGFELAEADLAARGAGDLFGRRQWGISDIGMEALKNLKLIRAAREEAESLVKKDPSLAQFPALQSRALEVKAALHRE